MIPFSLSKSFKSQATVKILKNSHHLDHAVAKFVHLSRRNFSSRIVIEAREAPENDKGSTDGKMRQHRQEESLETKRKRSLLFNFNFNFFSIFHFYRSSSSRFQATLSKQKERMAGKRPFDRRIRIKAHLGPGRKGAARLRRAFERSGPGPLQNHPGPLGRR